MSSNLTPENSNFKLPRNCIHPDDDIPGYEPEMNHAVVACIRAWNEEWDKLVTLKAYQSHLEKAAANCYRRAMPPLSGRRNIRDFIACIAKGMLIGAIDRNEGPKFIYAAQVAYSSCEPFHPPRQPGRPRG